MAWRATVAIKAPPIKAPGVSRGILDHEHHPACRTRRWPANGQSFVRNRKNPVVSTVSRRRVCSRHKDLITALTSLGLNETASQINDGVQKLPHSGQGMDEAELIRKLCLELRKQS